MPDRPLSHSYHLLRSSIHQRSEGARTTFRFDGRVYADQDLDDERLFASGSRLSEGDAADLLVTSAWLSAHPEVWLPTPEEDEPLVMLGYFRTPVTAVAVAADPVSGRTEIRFRLSQDGPEHRVDRDDLRRIHPEGGDPEQEALYLSADYLRELGAWATSDEAPPDAWHEIDYCSHLGGDAEVVAVDGDAVTFVLSDGSAEPRPYTAALDDPLCVAPFPASTLRPQVGARGRVVPSHFFLTRQSLEAPAMPEPASPTIMGTETSAAKLPRPLRETWRGPKEPVYIGAEAKTTPKRIQRIDGWRPSSSRSPTLRQESADGDRPSALSATGSMAVPPAIPRIPRQTTPRPNPASSSNTDSKEP